MVRALHLPIVRLSLCWLVVLALPAGCGADPERTSRSLEAESIALLERWAEVIEAVRAGGSVAIAVEQLDQIRARLAALETRWSDVDEDVRAESRAKFMKARQDLAERIGRALLDMDLEAAIALTARAHR